MSNHGIRNHKQQQADELVNSKIIRLDADEALPSIRNLMKDSGLGRIVLQNSINEAIARGLLRPEPKRGYFRTDTGNNRHNKKTIDIIACSEVNYFRVEGFHSKLIQYLFHAGTNSDYSMRIHTVKYSDQVTAYLDLIQAKEICNCFLISPENREIHKLCKHAGAQCVVITPHYDIQEGPAVIDAPDIMDLHFNHLLKQGHRHIAYLYGEGQIFSSVPYAARLANYYRHMAEAGLKVLQEWVKPGWNSDQQLRLDLGKMLNSRPRPTAIIVDDTFHLPEIYAYLAARKLIIGRDISIIADGESCPLRPAPTLVFNSPRPIAELAWELLMNLMAGKPENRILAPKLFINPGASVASLKNP